MSEARTTAEATGLVSAAQPPRATRYNCRARRSRWSFRKSGGALPILRRASDGVALRCQRRERAWTV